MAQLPEIKLTCRNDHTFASRARGSSSVSCPECRKDGQRVSVWVTKDRPRTATRSRAAAGNDDQADELATMTARWAREPAWDGKSLFRPGRPGLDECAECGELVQWEPRRTLIFCTPCSRAGLPPAVAEHYARQAQRSTEVATRAAPADPAAIRAARVRLRALKQRMIDRLSELIDEFDPDGLSGNPERLTLDYRAELAAYLPEIKNAASESDLTEIVAEIGEITDRANSSGARAAIERQRDAIERQRDAIERAAEEAEQAEWEAEEAERLAAIEARTQRKAIEGPAARTTVPRIPDSTGYVGAAVSVMAMIERGRAAKERKLNQHGPCEYEHKKPAIPERRYWITTLDWNGNQSGYELPNAPSVVVCKKHFALADKWIEEKAAMIRHHNNGVQILAVHTELP